MTNGCIIPGTGWIVKMFLYKRRNRENKSENQNIRNIIEKGTALAVPSVCQKSLAEFAARRRQRNKIIFSRDMCVRENTTRAASVEFVRHRRTNYARSRPQAFCRKNPEGFSTVSDPRSCDLGTPCVKKSAYRKNLFAGPLSSTGSIPGLYTRTGPPGAGPQ